jgi:AcrR family transcriptional regulator
MNKYSLKFEVMKPRDENKIDDIYRATLHLVKEKGLSGITMGQIAKEAGLATGTVYIYFTNKDELINSLFTTCRKGSAAIYFKDLDPAAPFRTGFRTIWMNIFRHRMERFEEAVFLEQCMHSPFITAGSRETANQLLQPLFALMERGKKENKIRNIDTILLLSSIIGSINEVNKHAHYTKRKLDKAELDEVFGLCWDGLKT